MPLPLFNSDPNQDQSLPVATGNDATGLPLRRVYIGPDPSLPDVGDAPVGDGGQFSAGNPTLNSVLDKLLGTNGQDRYQLWPEKLVRDALAAPHDAMNTTTPVTSEDLIKPAMDVSAMAGTGGLAGAGEEAGAATLGAGPFLRPALKYEGKIYKAPMGGQHMDAIPADLQPEFTRQAMNGEDISNFNFGFMNHKGQFLDREKAMDYAVKEGLIDPRDAKYGALTSTLMADSGKEASAIDAAKDWNVKGFENADWYHGTTHDFDKFSLAKGNIENHLGQYPHFTSSPKDASANYAGHGPDLTGRIERRAEEVMNDKENDLPSGESFKYGTPEYKAAYEDAKKQAAKEIAGPHEGAIIPAKLKMNNPADVRPNGKTWIDFAAKTDKDGEWVKENPNTFKLLNSLKKQGEKYGFDGQKAFDEVSEKANLYDSVKAHDLDKALRSSDELMNAQHPQDRKMVSSHVVANVFKDLGFDGVVMDAKSAFPNMKNIDEGTLHAIPLKRNSVSSAITGKKLYSDSSKPATAIEAFSDKYANQGVRNHVYHREKTNEINLSDLRVPKDQRNQGVGSQFMKELTGIADNQKSTVTLNAALDYGATSLNRLKKFYKNFGFVENKGKNYDASLSGNMYRNPKGK